MYTTKREKEKKVVIEAVKPRNQDLHEARHSRRAGRICENRKARGAERRESLKEHS